MNAYPSELMAEATRLTRAGRLPEATRLLQGVLRGGVSQASPTAPPCGGQAAPTASRASGVIDIDPATGAAQDAAVAPTTGRADCIPGGQRRAGAMDNPTPHWPLEALRGAVSQLQGHGLRPRRQAQRHGASERLPEGASFTTHSFSNEAGSRSYKLYIPAFRRAGSPALIVMLHGCTQSPDDFAAGTRMNALAEEHGFLVAYPAQAPSANAQRCWNWFSPGDQHHGAGEPALIAGITRQVMQDHATDAGRVYVAGLSAGGAAAAIMGQTYPGLYAAVGVHSGLACGAARDVPSAFAAMRQGAADRRTGGRGIMVPTIVFHAADDGTVHPRNGDQVIAQSAGASPHDLRVVVEHGQVPGGHAYTRTLHHDTGRRVLLEQWLVHGGGHAWSGGSPAGTYTDPAGPDASREMVRFFLTHGR